MLRRLAGFFIRKIQGVPAYRKAVKLFRSGIEITEADEDDVRIVYAWFNPGDAEVPIRLNPNVTDFVAKKGRKVVGFVQMVRQHEGNHPYKSYWLYSLVVKPLYRGMGVGEELTIKVIQEAKEEGAEELLLLVREDNQRAISLYRKLGFEIVALPALEEMLEKERLSLGYRRVAMRKGFGGGGQTATL